MKDVNKLKREKEAIFAKMRAIADTAEKRDDTNLTEEERASSETLQTELRAKQSEITLAETLNEEEVRTAGEGGGEGGGEKTEFRDFAEVMGALVRGDHTNLETREMSAGVGAKGGHLIPKQFDSEIRAMKPEEGVVRPNALVIPAGTNPDATIELPSLDQTGDKGVHSGVKMKWTAEGGTVEDAGDPTFIMVSLTPNNLTGYIDVTNKLLSNLPAFASYIQQILAGAMFSGEEQSFYLGDGVGKPLGILNSPAVIKVPRTTPSVIEYQDLVAMNIAVKGKNLKWVINRGCLQSLQTMVADNTNTLVWQQSAIVSEPDTLLGIPIEYNEFSPVHGTYGDIALLDMGQYAIKDGTGISIFLDQVTQYGNGKTRIYISWNVDGQSLVTSPILSEDKETKRSPFVALN